MARVLGLVVSVLAACATAGDQEMAGSDARPPGGGPDGRPGGSGTTDGRPFNPADAPESFQPLPDARPPAPPPDAPPGCTPAWRNLLVNPSLDSGPTVGWTTYSAGGVDVITDAAPLTPHSPAYVAWLAGYNGGHEQLWQSVVVPASATQLRFRGYGCFVTSEVSAGTFDYTTVSLHDTASMDLLELLVVVTNEDAGTICDFASVEAAAPESFAGRNLDVLLEGRNDVSYPTSFWWDSLALEAYACP